jgi:hypothetical protein
VQVHYAFQPLQPFVDPGGVLFELLLQLLKLLLQLLLTRATIGLFELGLILLLSSSEVCDGLVQLYYLTAGLLPLFVHGVHHLFQ